MASPMKKSFKNAGDFFGTLGGKVESIPTNVEKKKLKGEIPSVPRSIYTSPSKKGTYGTNKTTLSERKGYKGVVSPHPGPCYYITP